MAYAVKYIVPFSSLILKISKKDFVGDTTTIVAAQPAVLHKWDEDDPIAPIKGSSLTANIIGVPLLDFYANNDDEYKGDLFKDDGSLLFSGFLVQDDCTEDVDDLDHVVSLSFTDNLGLLKDVIFDGSSFTNSKLLLSTVIQFCLEATGLELPINVYAALLADNQVPDNSFLDQTMIAKETFLKSEREYDDCYAILESILTTFKATLIQAGGSWNIVRFLERPVKGFVYDYTFAYQTTTTFPDAIMFGYNHDLYPEYGYHKKIERPYKYVKETFNYRLPYQILKNSDLKDLGNLITTYTINEEDYKPGEDADNVNDYVVTVKEYGFPQWFDSSLAPQTSTYFIRTVTDNLGNELERYVVVKGDAIMSTAIEGNEGDAIKFSFGIRTPGGIPLPANLVFVIQLSDGTRIRYADNDGSTWKNTFGYSYPITTPLDQWQRVELSTGRLPFNGLVRVFLSLATPDPNNETHYNDLNFQYTAYINESTKITGQTHTTTQDIIIKNKSDETITIDDSPRNFISGTLFLTDLVGNIQNRTRTWNRGKRLGRVITGEMKQWRSEPRTVTEGTLYGDVFVSPLNTFRNPAFPEVHFVPGNMEIDYGNNSCTGTMYELYKTVEAPVVSEYKFEYIYDTK